MDADPNQNYSVAEQSTYIQSSRFPLFSKPKKILVALLLLIIIPVVVYAVGRLGHTATRFIANRNLAFTLVESSPEDQDSAFPVTGQPTFVFSKGIGVSENNIQKYVHINPVPPGSWHLEKNGQVIYFASNDRQATLLSKTFPYNTAYAITIDKSLPSTDGKTLGKTINFEFRTQNNSAFTISLSKKLINVRPDEVITIPYYNNQYNQTPDQLYPTLQASIYSVTKNQAMSYLTYKKGKLPLYAFTLSPNNQKIADISLASQIPTSSQGSQFFTLPKIGKPGLYYVIIKNNLGSTDFLITITTHTSEVFLDASHLYVWTTQNGKSLPLVNSSFYALNNKATIVGNGTTNDQGVITSDIKSNTIDIITTEYQGEIGITPINQYSNPFFNQKSQYDVFAYVDRPVYKPGDTVHYKAIVRKKDNGSYLIPSNSVYIGLDVSSNVPIAYKQLQLDKNATVTYDLILPKTPTTTYPLIRLSLKNGDSYDTLSSTSVIVQAYRKPDMNISSQSISPDYISKDTAHFTATATTAYGNPLPNTEFTYRVLRTDYTEIKDRSLENISTSYYGQDQMFTSGNGKFDNKGRAVIDFLTTLTTEQSQVATIEITPKIAASPSIATAAVIIHRGEFAVFFDNTHLAQDNTLSGTIEVLNHNHPRSGIKDKEVTISLYKVAGYNDKQFVIKQAIKSTDNGSASFSFTNQQDGNYELVAQADDSRGNTVTTRSSIYGKSNPVTQSATPLSQVTLSANKTVYSAGETAVLTVSANFPIEDMVALTTVSGQNYYPTIIKLTQYSVSGNSYMISVPMFNGYAQPMGIDVFAVNNGQVISGHKDFPIDNSQGHLTTKLSFDKTSVRPGDTITAEITTLDKNNNPVSADTSLSIIDATLLQIRSSGIGDIANYFYPDPKSLSGGLVRTFNSTEGISSLELGGAGGCFLQGTKITIGNGSLKNIEDVRIGDVILTRASDLSNALVQDTVTNTFQHQVIEYLTINNSLNITPIHRIFVNNAWITAQEIKIGDKLLSSNGSFIQVDSIKKHTGSFTVYNLTTQKFHTFFADGIYVHNEKGGVDIRKNFIDVLYWNPHIQTDASGKAHIPIKVSDNTTTFSATAVANTQDSFFGQTQQEFVSKKDFTITPTIPNFYFQGDKPVLSALIQNNTSNDIDGVFTLTIKELGITKSTQVHISKNDFESVAIPIDLNTSNNKVTMAMDLSSAGGKLDVVSLEKVVLPRGVINSSWMSFEGSKSMNFSAEQKDLDVNTIILDIVPHLAYNLLLSIYDIQREISVNTAGKLYLASYIIAKTQDGSIPPQIFKYAHFKNSFRTAFGLFLEKAEKTPEGTIWKPTYLSDTDYLSASIWTLLALTSINQYKVLPENTSYISSLINDTNKYLISRKQDISGDNAILYNLAMNTQIINMTDGPASRAVNVLQGHNNQYNTLLSKKLTSADDRLIWNGKSELDTAFPVLAVVSVGSKSDADKAVKGLSVIQSTYGHLGSSEQEIFAGLAALQHAVKYSLLPDSFDKPVVKLYEQDTEVSKLTSSSYDKRINYAVAIENQPSNSIKLRIETNSSLPIYTTILQNQFISSQSLPVIVSGVTSAKEVNDSLTRELRSLADGTLLADIQSGQSAIIALKANLSFMKLNMNSSFPNLFDISLTDAISPAFMLFNQSSGNSPQNQSTLNTIYPGTDQYNNGYISMSDYSQQAVFFQGVPPKINTAIMPYVVYKISDGSYYQPKTSLVFTNLGVILKER